MSIASRQMVLAAKLIGRDQEVKYLNDLVARAAEGKGQLVFLVGEAGVGKSRLAKEFMEVARARNFGGLLGRAVQNGNLLPFRPLSEAFLAYLRYNPLSPPDFEQLKPFLPALSRVIPEWRSEVVNWTDESEVMLAEGLLRLLKLLFRKKPGVLVLEDLHWADPDTLRIVEYLADNIQTERLVCLVTVRSDQNTPA